jgi:hypothetical protein
MLGAALAIGCTGTGEPAGPGQGLPAVGRPLGATQGPRVAVVVALRGDVKVETAGEGMSFTAKPELQLLRDDRLVVGPDSFVVVALYNGHMVRLNAGTDLRVDATATFHDPPAGADIEESFAQLLTPSERDDVALRGAVTRVAGWNTRMSAAETIAPQAPPTPSLLEAPVRAEEDAEQIEAGAPPPSAAKPAGYSAADQPMDGLGGGGSAEPPQQRTTPAKDDAPATDTMPGAKKAKAPNKPESDKDEGRDAPSSGASSKPGPTTTLDLPKIVVHQADRDGKRTNVSLPGPFVPVRAELAACAGAGAKIRGQISGKKLVELQVNGAAKKCVPGLIGKAVALEDGWIEMTVTP